MTEAKELPNLLNLITPETTFDQLKGIIGNFIAPEDEKILGGKSAAVAKVADSIACLGSFAPAPGTFDKKAFLTVISSDLPREEGERIWEIDKRMGVLKDEPKERVSVSPELVSIAKNQFLSD